MTRGSSDPRQFSRWLPGLDLARTYRVRWLRHDLAAGIVLATMLVPVGIAYAVASGLPGIQGLYASIVPLVAYAIFGPSRILVLGPDSSLAPLILGVVLALSAGDPQRAVAVGSAMALVSGLVCIAAGVGRLGFITELLSKPIRLGYMNGIAISILVSQLPKLLGFSIPGGGPFESLAQVAGGILAGKTNVAVCLIGAGCLLLMLVLKRFPRIPGVLVAVALATAAVSLFDLSARYGVGVLGRLPQGLPLPALPSVALADLGPILVGGLAVALVSFADTSVLSRVYAARTGTTVDASQEMVGLGAANLAAGLFQGFPISSSSSRTPVAEAAGARTQVTGLVGAATVALLLLAAPDLLKDLPSSALAAVVIGSALGLVEWDALVRVYRMQPWEFWLSIVCSLGVAVFGVIPGIGFAIFISVAEFLWDGWRPHSAVLGKPRGVEGFHDVTRYPGAEQKPGLLLFRWDAPLFFANAEFFRERIMAAVAAAAHPVRWVVVSAEPVSSIDVTSAEMLVDLHAALADRGIAMRFAELKDPVRDKFRQFDLSGTFGDEAFFSTLDAADRAFSLLPECREPS